RVIVWKEIVSSNTVTLQTLSGIITAQIKENIVKLKMSKPHSFTDKVQIKIKKKTYTGSFINTGVPHTVFFEEDIETINLAEIGPKVRYDQQFQPEGTNVNFVQITGNNSLSVRTYERGVEAETYACGTGAVASAVIGHLKGSLNEKIITVTTKGGELTVEIDREDREIENVYLASEASIIYSGQYLGEIENG
ncbi:MAG TPA: diaminopimelate epimerase, partial [Candidatus Omnitrophica bacterium]|nr:diaminopimelate epimerase [Candidatus Omnitrophota bacterium]